MEHDAENERVLRIETECFFEANLEVVVIHHARLRFVTCVVNLFDCLRMVVLQHTVSLRFVEQTNERSRRYCSPSQRRFSIGCVFEND